MTVVVVVVGYVVECSLDSPTPVPVELNGDIDEIHTLILGQAITGLAAFS